MVSADASMQIAERQGTLVAKTTDGIAVLKGEIRQDAYRGTDTERKEAELKDMQKQQQQEMAFQFAMLGEAEGAMQAGPETDNAKVGAQANADKTFQVSGLSAPQQEEQAAQQGFQVAIHLYHHMEHVKKEYRGLHQSCLYSFLILSWL